ncbi:hypothetical protein EDC04DRAFT_141879 [Pisolithus marmoratus]|nr:hypothetical protein EDC04DRAFT_141879 [Pisolithus marmoratus]
MVCKNLDLLCRLCGDSACSRKLPCRTIKNQRMRYSCSWREISTSFLSTGPLRAISNVQGSAWNILGGLVKVRISLAQGGLIDAEKKSDKKLNQTSAQTGVCSRSQQFPVGTEGDTQAACGAGSNCRQAEYGRIEAEMETTKTPLGRQITLFFGKRLVVITVHDRTTFNRAIG